MTARHGPPDIAVAHDGDGQHPRRRCAHAHADARQDQQVEAVGEGGQHAEGDIDADAREQHGASSVTIRQRAIEQLRPAEAQQIGGDDPLTAVLIGHA